MFKFLNKHLEESILVLLLSIMTILIGAQVFMRYVLNDSLTWSEELARYCFIWATYLGVSYGVRENAHIYVEIVTNRLPISYQRYAAILSHFVFIFFAIIVMKEGYLLSMKVFKFGQTSSSLNIPMGYIYLAPTVGFGLVILRLLQKITQEIRTIRFARQS
ncbi:C4-dicarboxylate ABC transporter [Oligella sp. HMSC05A10]|uniref:TRAP transporter small permease n=1 Tax=Oligella sp. HMSC05A10 TaxID=1581112 RepID=UPI0008A2047C|nr:TRAP transporter small permease [Oligella sp. HMSC05A10]OFS85616.1 C4-dicarboxylate ABC transporter [Oligella sp. HMSC05A10]